MKRKHLTLAALIFACIFSVTVPLVSEASAEKTYHSAPNAGDSYLITDEKETLPQSTPETEAPESVKPEVNEGGEVLLNVFLSKSGETVAMTLEEYIVCVVAAEMPYTFHAEALKAQAVAARSYCIYKLTEGNTHQSGADICTDYSHCAAFVTEDELIERYGSATTERILSKVKNAVESTSGQIITYGGRAALAVFHSSSYKYTESSKNIWGGDLPYLVSVSTPEEDKLSSVTLTDAEVKALFKTDSAISVNAPAVSGLTSQLNDSGRHNYLILGGKAVNAKVLRQKYGFRSLCFEYERTEDGWIFTVHGYGHGVGMSQYGANEMAKNGASYDKILTHYYSGVKLENIGEEISSYS